MQYNIRLEILKVINIHVSTGAVSTFLIDLAGL